MKTLLSFFIIFITLLQGCSSSVENLAVNNSDFLDIKLPKSSEIYGKEVAVEMRKIVDNLNRKGFNLSKIDNKAKVENFYSAAYKASSNTNLNSEDSPFSTSSIIETINTRNEITKKQKNFINKIAKAYSGRISDLDFKQQLIEISEKVYKNVPKIEQERIFNIISILYYGISEIEQLEKKGQIVRSNAVNNNIPRLKSSSESGDDGECRQENSAISYVFGFINSVGEKVTNVTQAAAGALGGFIITWCKNREVDNIARCSEIYSACQSPGNHPTWVNKQPGTSMSKCAECLMECTRSNGQWLCGTNFRIPYN